MKAKTIEQLIDQHYEDMFDRLCNNHDTDFGELVIEVKIPSQGKTVRRSWKDREQMLDEENDRQIKFDKLVGDQKSIADYYQESARQKLLNERTK